MHKADLVHPQIRAKLARLKTALRLRLAGEAAAWMMLALVAAVFATLLLDYMFRLDRIARLVAMAAAGVGLAYVVIRNLVIPLRVPMDEDALVLLIERRWRQLSDRLISAVQFARSPEPPPGASEELIARMAAQANEQAADLPFGELVDRRRLRQALLAGVSGVMLLAGFCFWQPAVMNLWLQRNVLMREIPWPQSTYLQVDGTDFAVLRGDNLTVRVLVEPRSSEVPAFVIVHAEYPSVGQTQERVDLAPDGRSYVKLFSAVSEAFRFHVTGGDDSRDTLRGHAVRLIEPPDLMDLECSVSSPAYMAQEPGPFQPVKGVIPAPLGSTLTFRGQASKPLRSVTAMVSGRPAGQSELVAGEQPSDKPTQILTRLVVEGDNAPSTLMLQFDLVDSDGYRNSRSQQCMIQIQPDAAPQVELASQGLGTVITANALVPLEIRVRDDHGVAAVTAGVAVPPAKTSATASGPATRPAAIEPATQPAQVQPPPTGEADYRALHEMDLALLNSPPQVGDIVQVYAEASDTMDLELRRSPDQQPSHLGPNRKRAVLEYKIVTPDEIRADLVRRQKEVSHEFDQTMLNQREAYGKTQEVSESAAATQPDPNARGRLVQSQRSQSGVDSEVAKAASQLRQIRDEMRYNRVYPQDVIEETAAVIDLLGGLGGMIRDARTLLDKAVAVFDAPQPDLTVLAGLCARAAQRQKEILDQMEVISKRMTKITDRQDIINQVELLKRVWDIQVIPPTERMIEKRVGGMFTPTSAPAAQPSEK